jgi:hypothetical protein
MAKQPAKNVNITISSVALESEIDSFSLKISQETPVAGGFGTAGPFRVVGNYDYSLDISGAPDFTAAKMDATLFALVGDTDGNTMAVDPTGATAGANDPNYDASLVVLSSMEISASVGGRVSESATLLGNSALARAVA